MNNNETRPVPAPAAFDGNWHDLTADEKDLVLASLAAEDTSALLIALHEQSMGGALDINYDVYPVSDPSKLATIFSDGSEYSDTNYDGPRSTTFGWDADEVLASPGEEIYGDSDFDSMNSIAMEVYYTYYPA